MAADFCTELNMILKNKFDFRAIENVDSELAAKITLFATFKESFDQKLKQYDRSFEGTEKQFWSRDRIEKVMEVIYGGRAARNAGIRRTSIERYWMKKCDVIKKGEEERLIFKQRSLHIVPREKYFDILSEIHTSCNHGGRHRMALKLKKKCFIPRNVIRLFVSMCPGCQAKRIMVNNNTNPRPNEAVQLNVKGRVNLINFKYCPDGEYKWLLIYQDDGTKYLSLRPLKSVMGREVTRELMKIFLTFGAPNILQLDMDNYFMAQVKQEIIGMWPNCQVVPKTNSKVNECYKQELEYIIQTWMVRNDTTKWTIGCYIIQYTKNNAIFRILGSTPYRMMFGCDPRMELSATAIPARILETHDEGRKKQRIKREKVHASRQDTDDKI